MLANKIVLEISAYMPQVKSFYEKILHCGGLHSLIAFLQFLLKVKYNILKNA